MPYKMHKIRRKVSDVTWRRDICPYSHSITPLHFLASYIPTPIYALICFRVILSDFIIILNYNSYLIVDSLRKYVYN
jgi:hypothetical protein